MPGLPHLHRSVQGCSGSYERQAISQKQQADTGSTHVIEQSGSISPTSCILVEMSGKLSRGCRAALAVLVI